MTKTTERSGHVWRDKPIEECTHEELLECVSYLVSAQLLWRRARSEEREIINLIRPLGDNI